MKFQQQPPIDSRITSHGDKHVEIYKSVLLPGEGGQRNREILDPKDEAQIQQEDIPLDLEPIPDNVDHWVRR